MRNVYRVLLSITVVLVVVVVAWFFPSLKEHNGATPSTSAPVLTSDACVAAGGEIINTLSEATPSYKNTDIIGEVVDARCPCVCVKKDRKPF